MAAPPAHAIKEDGRLLRGEATKEKVLDAAERLFADHGFDGVSIRQIADAAGVTLGVVGFHSGSKLELFKTIIARRVAMLSEARRRALRDLRADTVPDLHGIVRAYVMPYIAIASGGDPQWRAYARLIAHIVSEERWYPVVKDLYDPVALEFLDAVRDAKPGIDPVKLAAAFVMSVASMLSIVAGTARIGALSANPSATAKAELQDYATVLVDFCVGGIEHAAMQ